MSEISSIFIDSSAFVAWFFERDTHHQQAVERFEWVKNHKLMPVTSTYVVDETATVLSNRQGQALALEFLDFIEDIQPVFVTEEMRWDVHTLFRKQSRRGTSLVDCSNIVVMQRLAIPIIFTYDGDFTEQFQVQVVC